DERADPAVWRRGNRTGIRAEPVQPARVEPLEPVSVSVRAGNRRDDAAGHSSAAVRRRAVRAAEPLRATEPLRPDADHRPPLAPAADAGSVALDGRLGAGRIRAGRESFHAGREPLRGDLAVR